MSKNGHLFANQVLTKEANTVPESYSATNGIRVIVSLNADLVITGGTGTESDPYIISAN